MPSSCCVPDCSKKGCRDEDGSKVSFYKFPDEKVMRKKWIHAIRRDEGKNFQITKWTKVCSRHFRQYDFIKTLSGRRDLRPDAVPSLFTWTRTSPRKRKAPVFREITEVISSNVSMQSHVTSDEEPNDTCTLHTAEEGSAQLEDYGRKDVHTQTGPETEQENDRE